MESGADNGVLSRCPSARSACWSAAQALTLASADAMALLVREHTAAARQTCIYTKTLTSVTTAPPGSPEGTGRAYTPWSAAQAAQEPQGALCSPPSRGGAPTVT